MIIGIGTDIFDVKRLSETAISEGDPFLLRAFTEKERAQGDAQSRRHEFFAGRFSAKEAVYKSISACKIEFRPGEIEIIDDENGKPCSKLLGKTKETFETAFGTDYVIHISISHETEIVSAFAVTEKL